MLAARGHWESYGDGKMKHDVPGGKIDEQPVSVAQIIN